MPQQSADFDITALASMAIAGCALIATFWQAKLARDHNRKSTTPLLNFHSSTVNGYATSLRNDGVGPAILADFHYFVDGEQCHSFMEVNERLSVPPGIAFFHADVTMPASIGVGQSVRIVEFSGTPNLAPQISDLAARLDIRVTYRSVYGQQFAASLK
jgi:hypothetical protein